jgi:hypothetical protein
MALAPPRGLPSTTMPPPTPVPRITPNTTDAPAPAPSTASDRAKAVGVVGEAHFALQYRLQVALQRLADQAGGIGILDQAGDPRLGSGDAHAHRAAGADFLFGALDQAGHGHDGAR